MKDTNRLTNDPPNLDKWYLEFASVIECPYAKEATAPEREAAIRAAAWEWYDCRERGFQLPKARPDRARGLGAFLGAFEQRTDADPGEALAELVASSGIPLTREHKMEDR